MQKYVAFLRAINLGSHTVKMDLLRSLFENMGFENVKTFLASGNVLFETHSNYRGGIERRIETALQSALGYSVGTFIRTIEELEEITRYNPFDDDSLDTGGSTLYISFTTNPPGELAVEKLLSLSSDTNQFKVHKADIYWLCQGRFSDSGITLALLEKALSTGATIRNVSTVKKIVEKFAA